MTFPARNNAFFRYVRALLCALVLCASAGAADAAVYGYYNGNLYEYTYSSSASDAAGDMEPSHWTASSAYNFAGDNNASRTIAVGDTIIVQAGDELTFAGGAWQIDGEVINYGTVTFQNDITNTGTITNYGTMKAGRKLVNAASATVINSGTLSFTNDCTNSGTITNSGTLSSSTNFTNESGGVFVNSGTATLSNTVNNGGEIDNSGDITATSINNTGGIFRNEGGTVTGSVNGGTVTGLGGTYYWTGKAEDGNLWTTSANWAADADGNIAVSGYPGSADGDTAVFTTAEGGRNIYGFTVANTGYKITLKRESTSSSDRVFINSSQSKNERIFIEGNINTYNGTEEMTLGSVTVVSGTFQVGGVLALTDSLTVKSGASVTSYADITVRGSLSVEENSAFSYRNDITVDGNVTIAGNVKSTEDGTLTFGDSEADTISNNGTITLGAGEATFGGTVTNAGTITGSSGALTFDGAVTNTGTITLNSGATTFSDAVMNSGGGDINCDTGAVVFEKSFSNTDSATFNAADSTSGSVTFDGAVTNAAIFDCQDSLVTFNNSYTADADSEFIASSGNTVFYGNADFSAVSDASDFDAHGGTVHFFGDGKTLKTANGQRFYCLCFGGNVTIDVSAGDMNVDELRMAIFSSVVPYRTTSFSATLTGSGKINAGSFDISRCSETTGVTGSLDIGCDVDVTGKFYTHSGTNTTIADWCTVTIGEFGDTSDDTNKNTISINGILSASGKDLPLGKNTALTVGSGGAITAANITNGNASNNNANKNTITNNGTITLSGSLTDAQTVTNTGSISADGSITGITSLTNSGADATLSATAISATSIDNTGLITAKDITASGVLKNALTLMLTGGSSTLSFGSYTDEDNDHVIIAGGNITATASTTATIGDMTLNGATTCTGFTGGLTISRSLLADKALTTNGALTVTGTGGASSTLKGNITTAGAQSYGGEVTIGGDVTLSTDAADGTVAFASNVTINNGAALTFGANASDAYDVTVGGSWANDNATDGLTANSSTVTFTGAGATISGSQDFAEVTFAGTGITLTGANTAETATFSGADITVTGGNNFTTAAFNGNNTVLHGTNTFTTATFTANTTITGDNTYTNFGCTTGGVTLTFAANTTQTVNGNFNITGEEGSLVTLTGENAGDSWTIDTSPTTETTATVRYAAVRDSAATTAFITALDSEDDGGNVNWSFVGARYTWTGADATEPTNWQIAANWTPKSVPGAAADVTIPEGCVNYPDVTTATTTHNITLNGELLLSTTAKLTVSGTFVNSGTVEYSNTGRITSDGTTVINDAAHDGTVKFSGTGLAIDDINTTDGYDYANLEIAAGTSATAAAAISARGVVTVAGSANFAALTVAANGADGGNITVAAGGGLTASGAVTADGNVTVTGTLTASGAVAANGSVTVAETGTSTASGDVTVSGNLALGGNATLNNAVAVAGEVNVSGSGTTTLHGALTVNGTLTLAGTGTIALNATNSGQTSTVGSFDASGMISGNVTFGEAPAATNPSTFTVTSGGLSIPAGVEATLGADITTNGSDQFYGGKVRLAKTGTLNLTAGTVTFDAHNAAANDADDNDVDCYTDNGTEFGLTINANAVFNGKVRVMGDLAIMGATTLGGGSVTTPGYKTGSVITDRAKGMQTYAGTVTLSADTSFRAHKDVIFSAEVNGDYAMTFIKQRTSSSGNFTFNNDVSVASLVITSDSDGATLTAADDSTITLTGDFTNNGSFTPNTSTVVFAGSGTSTIGGSKATTFYNLTCETPGKTLAFPASSLTTTVTNAFTVNGAADTPITLTGTSGTWKLDVAPARASVQYAVVENSQSQQASIFALSSKNGGANTNWVFNAVWTGAVSDDWSDGANWLSGAVPASSDIVTYAPASAHSPVLTSEASVGYIEIPAGASLTLAGNNFTASGVSGITLPASIALDLSQCFINSGTVITQGTETITLSGGVQEQGCWHYTGTGAGTVKPITGVTYNKLIISGTIGIASPYSRTNPITATSGITLGTADDTATIDTATAVYIASPVTLANDATIIAPTHMVEFVDTVAGTHQLTIQSGYVHFKADVGGSEPLASLSCTTGGESDSIILVFGARIATTGAQSYTGELAVYDDDATLVSSAGDITFNQAVFNDGRSNAPSHALTVTAAGAVTFADSVGVESDNRLSALTVQGATITVQSGVLTSGAQLYTGAVTLSQTGVITGGTTLDFNGDVTNDGSIAAGSGDITISGALTNASGATVTGGTGDISVANGVTNSGSLTTAGNFSCGDLTVNAGSVSVSGALSTGAIVLHAGAVTFGGDASAASVAIDAGAVLTAGTQASDALTLTVSGNWTNAADAAGFVANSGTVCFTGSGATVSGNNAFATARFAATATISGDNSYNAFICETAGVTLTFGGGKTQRITSGGSFTVTGADGTPITLIAVATNDESLYWRLDANPDSVSVSVRYAIVSYAWSISSIGRYVEDSEEGVNGTTVHWFDGVAPQIMLTLAPVGASSMYVIFDRALGYSGELLTETSFAVSGAQNALANAFDFVTAASNGASASQELTVKAARLIANHGTEGTAHNYAVLRLDIEGVITLTHVRTLWLRVTSTAVQDESHTELEVGTVHCLSDFALNAVSVQYALSQTGARDEQSKAIHDFDADARSRLLVDRDLLVQAQLTEDGTHKAADGVRLRLYASAADKVAESAVSARYNARTGSQWRVWLPKALKALATDAATSARAFDAVSAGDSAGLLWNTTLPNAPDSADTLGWQTDDEAQFLFQLLNADGSDVTVQKAGRQSEETVPLYALSLPNGVTSELPFVDLWSLRFTEPQKQRGGVSILNNVINVAAREQTTIEVYLPSSGTLNVYVLTADGNIVRRLEHGRVSSGKHYYRWNGTNASGNPVARGIYFIRVTGSGIDETRKVMCVKE